MNNLASEKNEIKNRLEILRKEKGETQDQVAKKVGVSKRSYIYWEKGERQIKPDKARALADHFGVSVGYLLGFTDISKQYDDERVEVSHDGIVRAYSSSRYRDEDFAKFIALLKELDIVISDLQANSVFDLIQSMNLHNDSTKTGRMFFDLTDFGDSESVYNDLAQDGFSLLVEDKSKS
ncbi:TPA: helix-turn-helix transcriptional regulator [Streptococcus suis]|uniref:helix-turn-helix transcriptional regulator n=1 Tax=Streptococcus suis TaxID=1307 RepID=UPI001ABED1E3|nr:helix-turn-helix transcriptional regulator [Streptococcus suis]MBO4112166.1 helix-turn-helix domain-containing protein [Streptococcus suis]